MLYRNIKQSSKGFSAIRMPNHQFVRVILKALIIKGLQGLMILRYRRRW